jgi:hypothetical protein
VTAAVKLGRHGADVNEIVGVLRKYDRQAFTFQYQILTDQFSTAPCADETACL